MIFEPKNLTKEQSEKIIERKKYQDKGGSVSCGHDFWEQAKSMEYGDVVLCTCCCQYFAKIKHLPWITIKKEWLGPKILGYGTNHLKDNWFVHVPVRVTD